MRKWKLEYGTLEYGTLEYGTRSAVTRPQEEPRGRRVAALLQRTNTMTFRTLAKGVGMSVAAALTLSLLWTGVANAQLSCANGQPPVTGLSGVPSCADDQTTALMVDGSVYRQTPEIYATEGPIYEIDVAN